MTPTNKALKSVMTNLESIARDLDQKQQFDEATFIVSLTNLIEIFIILQGDES